MILAYFAILQLFIFAIRVVTVIIYIVIKFTLIFTWSLLC
jgi:hypothetical protein